MKTAVLILLFFFGFPFLTAETMPKISFAQAQNEALKHSEELSIAELETLIATEKIREIRGINFPKLSADGCYNVRNNDLGFVRKNPMYKKNPPKPPHSDGGESDHPPPPKQPKEIKTIAANKEVSSGKVSLIVPVYDFGYVSNLVKAQTSTIEATVHEKERVKQNILFAVANSFYRALEGAKLEEVVDESMKVLQAQLATARDLYSTGLVTQNDVLVVEVQLATREQERIQTRHTIESALSTLSRLTGRQIKAIEELEDIAEEVAFDTTLASIIKKADTSHPVLKKLQADSTAASFDLEATRAENYPDINAFVNAHASSDSYLLHKNWLHAGLSIDIPIFDGGIVASKVKQKRKAISALDLQYAKAIEDIHLEIQKAFLQVDSAFHQIPVAKKSIHLAEDNLLISKDLFQEGQIMSDDVLDNEERLAEARSNYYQAIYDFYIARAALDYAAGLIQIQGVDNVG